MYLDKLSVLNFKNHSDSSLDFNPNINCFVGNNGSGKTNLLDAIHYLSFTKSFFIKQDSMNVLYNQPFMTVEGVFEKDDKKELVQCAVKSGVKKIVKRNKKQYDKLAEHIGLFPLVMVSPTDSELLLAGSDVRRKYMDSVISQFDKEYLNTLIAYSKLILQRNALLKSMDNQSIQISSLALYDEQLSPLAQIIFEKRQSFLNQLSPIFLDYYNSISNTNEEVSILYDSQLSENSFLDLCQQNFEKDRIVKFTSVGVHKDDLVFHLNGYPIKRIGSQGQQKTYLLALKLAQFDFMQEALGYKPMLLLDDIFDKLDDNRVEHLMKLVDQHHFGQIFVTDTHPGRSKQIFDKINADYKLFHIKDGAVEKEE
jgi:DNA replication and repair protein RecF